MELHQEKVVVGGKPMVVYECPGVFPYACALSGLFRASSEIVEVVEECPRKINAHCILCESTDLVTFGKDWVYICAKHDWEWGEWLDDHPDTQERMFPKGRLKRDGWVEAFREFIESKRAEKEVKP
jgi:hypothetical protein